MKIGTIETSNIHDLVSDLRTLIDGYQNKGFDTALETSTLDMLQEYIESSEDMFMKESEQALDSMYQEHLAYQESNMINNPYKSHRAEISVGDWDNIPF